MRGRLASTPALRREMQVRIRSPTEPYQSIEDPKLPASQVLSLYACDMCPSEPQMPKKTWTPFSLPKHYSTSTRTILCNCDRCCLRKIHMFHVLGALARQGHGKTQMKRGCTVAPPFRVCGRGTNDGIMASITCASFDLFRTETLARSGTWETIRMMLTRGTEWQNQISPR